MTTKRLPKIPRPEAMPPVDAQEFQFAVLLASSAFGFRMPMQSPSQSGVTLQQADGTQERLVFTDVLENRAMFAIRDHFAGNPEAFFAAAMRFFALQRMWKSARMSQWLKPAADDPQGILVNEAVFRAAATLPMNAEGYFDEDAFFARVQEVASDDE